MREINYDQRKFEELVLHLCQRSEDDPRFGATKLNKLLFYIDFGSYVRLGMPVTGATYRRLPTGPAPREMLSVREKLLDTGDANIEQRPYLWRLQDRLVARREPDLSVFSADELSLVDEVVGEFWHHNARAISEESHREWGWLTSEEYADIPYQTAWVSSQPLNDEQIERGQQLAEELGLRR